MASLPVHKARTILEEYGIENPADLDLEELVYARNAILEEIDLENSDGRTVFGTKYSIISINKNIEYEGRKRFTIAHELGHVELHRNLQPVFLDDESTLQYFQKGSQETEANEFASELLMPESLFRKYCVKKVFSGTLLKELSEKFKTSITSTAFRFIEIGNHPICVFFSRANKLIYYKKSVDFNYWPKDLKNLPLPEDSAAFEFYKYNNRYPFDKSPSITKDTWLQTRGFDNDDQFFEYCIITPKYETVISIIWEK